ASSAGIEVTAALAPLTFPLGESKVTVSADHVRWMDEPSGNDRSALVRIDRGESSILLTGDITAGGEIAALYDPGTAAMLRGADVLQIPHHGSDGSSSPLFLREVLPAVALISVGENHYGHPSPEVLSRLETLGCHILRTDRDGTVQLTTPGDGVFTIRTEGGVP
ncbi:MAG: MBL fold metallo-hydrolase, partial [Clostridia bacterium]|nr:MBL fold metallo-hydrolase [Clostridia bacterium]